MDPNGNQYHHEHPHGSLPQPPQAQHQQQYQYPQQSQQPQSQAQPQLSKQQQQQGQQHKPQTSHSSTSSRTRGFSFGGNKERKNSHDKEHLHETAAEKESKRLHSKADPTLAISEAEPSQLAMEENSLGSIRSIVHRDNTGNPIVDPDKSNPTRSRWERPLDTIRSFEAAIEGSYNTRRSSAFIRGGGPARYRPDSIAGSRPVSMRPDGGPYDYRAGGPSRSSVYDGQGYSNGNNVAGYGYASARQRPARNYSEASNQNMYGRDQNGYQLSHKDRSYETVTSAAASGGSDPAGYQTDPTSSDNSSIERRSPARRQEPMNDYGIGFSQPHGNPDPNFAAGMGSRSNHPLPLPPAEAAYPGQQQQQQPRAIPRKEAPSLLKRQPTQQSVTSPPENKRKSWLSRKFSRNS